MVFLILYEYGEGAYSSSKEHLQWIKFS